VLTSIARQENIEVADASLTVIARAAGGSFRDAISTFDQLSTYSGGHISLQETLDILGIVQHDLLTEIVEVVHDHDTQGALLFVERLNQAGTDYNQFMKDLLGYLRDMYVVRHTADTPPSVALSEEQVEALRAQAVRVPTMRIVTFIDLLGEALRAVRQGSDARLELELALIKMTAFGPGGGTRPEAEMAPVAATPGGRATVSAGAPVSAGAAASAAPPTATESSPAVSADGKPEQPEPTAGGEQPTPAPEPAGARPATIQADIDHLKRAWPVVLEAIKKRQAGLSAVLAEGRPESLDGNELVVKFPAGYGFQANQVSRGDNPMVIADALKEITGRDLRVVARVATEPAAEPAAGDEDARILSKDELIRVLKQEFDAQIIDDGLAR
jgi:DNA polymerase-3 subunit gamma/tau